MSGPKLESETFCIRPRTVAQSTLRQYEITVTLVYQVTPRFDQLARHILDPAISLGDDADKMLSLRSTYTLYEYWCFFAVAEALQQTLPGIAWQRSNGASSNELYFNLTSGLALRAEVGLNRLLTLSFQECYPTRFRDDGLPASNSRECNPDIVLTYERQAGRKILILDAKYRSAVDSIQAGLDDMHVYRAAIRTASGESAIAAAFILTPTHTAAAQRFYTPDRSRHCFGAFDLVPRNPNHRASLVDCSLAFVA